MKQGKVWGQTEDIFSRNNVSIHRIEVSKNALCSKHLHEHKYNTFYVESGTLVIDVWKKDYDLMDTTVLKAGDSTDVKPMEYHQFIAAEDTVAYEIYWTILDEDDITRDGVGSAE